MILTFDLENLSKVTTYMLFISSVHVKYKPKTAKSIIWMHALKKEFYMVIYDLDLQTSFNVTVHNLTIDTL